MTTLERIEYQKQIALDIVSRLEVLPYDIGIAGGAPRDWYFNSPANDIDIFVCDVPSNKDVDTLAIELHEAIGVPLHPLLENRDDYESKFHGWEFYVEDQKVQILCHFNPFIDTVEQFPIAVSRIYWDGEFHKHWTFALFENWNVMHIDEFSHYVAKISERLGYPYSGSLKGILLFLGRTSKNLRNTLPDWDGMDAQMEAF